MENETEEATKKIAELVAAAMASIKQAEELAVKHRVEFSWDLAYGMGGTFCAVDGYGEPVYDVDGDDEVKMGWFASSRSC